MAQVKTNLFSNPTFTRVLPFALFMSFIAIDQGLHYLADHQLISIGPSFFHWLYLPKAILTGLLGYLLVIGGLMVDLGRPYNVWRPLIHWQHHSVMWEVGLCVASYTTVLFIEFLPLLIDDFLHGLDGVGTILLGRRLQTHAAADEKSTDCDEQPGGF